ncbi:MAG: L-histidine N(alpha)-methyltransferase [Acetobacteraceae bacterium]|nr:L-histidine N(alpha)-methyltransferase [Acetobacteraceae bacterium]
MLDAVQAPAVVQAVAAAALRGLLARPKSLPPMLFYDEEGCRLFGQITALPEYYLTRVETALLAELAPAIGAAAPAGAALVEYGASREDKAALLLPQLRAPRAYVPIDIAAPALQAIAARMAGGAVAVHPVAADFQAPLVLPAALDGVPRLGFFPGSTIGNLAPDAAVALLRQMRATLGAGALLVVGADVRKDAAVLLPAYDDAAGVTAAFNRNVLTRLNREAGADFDLAAFRHEARWNDAASRVEMHLVSERAQTRHVAGRAIRFAAGESIHTENSYKHTVAAFRAMAAAAGWRAAWSRTDAAGRFGVHLLQAPAGG